MTAPFRHPFAGGIFRPFDGGEIAGKMAVSAACKGVFRADF